MIAFGLGWFDRAGKAHRVSTLIADANVVLVSHTSSLVRHRIPGGCSVAMRAGPSCDMFAAMFAIEIVIVRVAKEPLVIDRATSATSSIDDADRSAQSLLEKARRMGPHNPPNGYRIIDGDGTVVVRSWER